MSYPNRLYGCSYIATHILLAIVIVVLIAFSLFFQLFVYSCVGATCLYLLAFYAFCVRCYCSWRELDNFLGYTWGLMIGPTDVFVSQILAGLPRNRRLGEIASALFRFYTRRHTQAKSTKGIATGHPENVGSAPEYDAARASSISNRDDESRSQTIRSSINLEPTRPLNPAYLMVTGPRPAWNEQHQNPSRSNLQSSIPLTLAPASNMEENIEERFENLTLKESEHSSPNGIITSPTPLPGPSGLQWRRDEESNETEVHSHSQSISCELDEETQRTTEK